MSQQLRSINHRYKNSTRLGVCTCAKFPSSGTFSLLGTFSLPLLYSGSPQTHWSSVPAVGHPVKLPPHEPIQQRLLLLLEEGSPPCCHIPRFPPTALCLLQLPVKAEERVSLSRVGRNWGTRTRGWQLCCEGHDTFLLLLCNTVPFSLVLSLKATE